MKSLEYEILNWSVDPQDYMTGNAQALIDRVTRRVRRGSIILMHDGLQDGPRVKQLKNRRGTITALPIMIDRLRNRGYTFVTLDQLFPRETE